MGQPAQEARKLAKSSAQSQIKDLSDFVDTGIQLLEKKGELYVEKILNSGNQRDKQIPIHRLLIKNTQVRCSVKQGDQIAQQVTSTISQFASGHFAQGIGSIIGIATKAILASGSASSSEKQGFFIAVSAIGAIIRIDYLVYMKHVKSTGLVEIAQNFFLCAYTISSVNASELTANDFAALVQICYKEEKDMNVKYTMLNRLIKAQLKNEWPSQTDKTIDTKYQYQKKVEEQEVEKKKVEKKVEQKNVEEQKEEEEEEEEKEKEIKIQKNAPSTFRQSSTKKQV